MFIFLVKFFVFMSVPDNYQNWPKCSGATFSKLLRKYADF